jgi:transaldolase
VATLKELYEKGGQSPWLDNIRRSWLEDGTLTALVEKGVRGLTSNPTIFAHAIENSSDYDEEFRELVSAGHSLEWAYWQLVTEDIGKAADLLRPVYESSHGSDGYVSIEVSPELAHSTEESIEQASELFARLARPNVLVKIPATREGVRAIEELIRRGVNVNATLIFSRQRYREVAFAYIKGLRRRAEEGLPVHNIFSVASFFVSRVDSLLDPLLADSEDPGIKAFVGRVGIYNARLAYQEFKSIFFGPDFDDLAEKGAFVQKPLWASTSTKNPAYPDVLYVEGLIGPHTINTMPDATLQAFLDHGKVEVTIEDELEQAQECFSKLAQAGIDFERAAQELEDKGVASFLASFREVIAALSAKAELLGRPA